MQGFFCHADNVVSRRVAYTRRRFQKQLVKNAAAGLIRGLTTRGRSSSAHCADRGAFSTFNVQNKIIQASNGWGLPIPKGISRCGSTVTTFQWDGRGVIFCRLGGIGACPSFPHSSPLSSRACGFCRENIFVSARHMIIYPWIHLKRAERGAERVAVEISLEPFVADYTRPWRPGGRRRRKPRRAAAFLNIMNEDGHWQGRTWLAATTQSGNNTEQCGGIGTVQRPQLGAAGRSRAASRGHEALAGELRKASATAGPRPSPSVGARTRRQRQGQAVSVGGKTTSRDGHGSGAINSRAAAEPPSCSAGQRSLPLQRQTKEEIGGS